MIKRYISTLEKDPVINGVFWLFLILILVNRIFLFLTVNIDCIDNDQVVMWLGAKDFSQGLFYAPRYYGQDYNTMMEGLFAVPFIKSGIPVYYAVPLATHLIFLMPFLFTAFYLYKKQKKEQAIVVLAVLLCMPVGYDIINSIPRGFVTGLFFTSLFIVSLNDPKNHRFILINVFLAYVGYLVNPNSVLVSAPVLFYLFLMNYQDKKFYIYSVIGLLLALPVDYGLNHFYKVHPDYVLYSFSNEFSIDYFKEAILNFNDRFAHIGFFIEGTGTVVLLTLAGTGILLYKKNIKLFFSFLLFIAILFVSFFSSKINDGLVWPFYSYGRMYLGLPVLLYLSITALDIDFKRVLIVLLPITILFTVFKETTLEKRVAYHAQKKFWGRVHLNKLSEIMQALDIYRTICREQGVNDFIMLNHVWQDDEINYGGPAVYDDFPNTFKPAFERRSWRIEEERKNVHGKFIVYTANSYFNDTINKYYKDIEVMRLYDCLFLVKNNKRTTVDFVRYINAATDGI